MLDTNNESLKMDRYIRTRILVEADENIVKKMADETAENCSLEVLNTPREELVTLKVRESSKGSLFYLGEALMTSCRVRLDKKATGFGYLLGANRSKALNLAIVDAAYELPISKSILEKWDEILLGEKKKLDKQLTKQHSRISKTRVDFSVMEGGA